MSNPKSSVIATMSGKSYTLGWDVLVAYNAASVNELFAAQYVTNVRANTDFPPITDTLSLTSTVTVQVTGLTLGPPLISFSPNTTNQEALVTLNFVAGLIEQVEASGNVTYIVGAQNIVPGDAYQVQLTVPLSQVSGTVTNQQNVILDLTSTTSATTNLLPGTTAASYLGRYFATIFQKSTSSGVSYQLGTLVFGSSEGLIPTSFDIRTQVYPGTSGPDGAVLLFVATKYNTGGGNYPGATFPYLIPDGNTCTLVIASKTLFGNILSPYYNNLMSGSPTFAIDQFSQSPAASYMIANGGTMTGPPVSGSWSSGDVDYSVQSGGCSFNGPANVTVPYSGWTFQPDNDLLSVSWSNSKFNQKFSGNSTMRNSFCSSETVTLTLNASMQASLKVSNQVVSLSQTGSPSVGISFSHSGWFSRWFGNGNVYDNAVSTLANGIKGQIVSALKVPLPSVNAFAVSHLLFPAENALTYSSAHLPGDLAIFGQVSPSQTAFTASPLQVVLGPGETQQFSVSENASMTWTHFPIIGALSSTGLYTAPAAVTVSIPICITATDANSNIATAVVTVVPSAVTVSPAYAIVLKSTGSVSLQAAVLGNAAVSWAISPNDGSVGTVSATGVYTAPTTFPTTLTTALITASAATTTGSSLLCLANVSIGISLAPMSVSLAPGGTQQFTATPSAGVAWSVQPASGSVDATGLYTAPATISEPSTVLVVATLDGVVYGFAPVYLAPSS